VGRLGTALGPRHCQAVRQDSVWRHSFDRDDHDGGGDIPHTAQPHLHAGVLMEIVTLAFPLYAKLVHGFNTYGHLAFLICQFMLLGAVLNRMLIGEEAQWRVRERHVKRPVARAPRSGSEARSLPESQRPGPGRAQVHLRE
jgi:hypothetical protein